MSSQTPSTSHGGPRISTPQRADVIGTLRRHRKVIYRTYGVKRIGVFGSYARGEAKETSDVDLLVEFEKPTFDGFMALLAYLEGLFGKKVDLVTVKALSPYMAPTIKKEVVWCD